MGSVIADEADDIAPFLDETVFSVARIDLERLEPAGIAPYLQGKSAPDAETNQLSELLSTVRQTLRELGVSRLYAVYSFNDIGEQMPYLVVPAGDAAHARRVAAYLYSGDPDGPTSLDGARQRPTRMFEVAEPIDATVFCGRRAARERLDRLTTPERTGLDEALTATENSPIAFISTPTADQRRVIAEMFPDLPLEVGGLSGAEIAGGVEWLAATVDPAAGSAALIAQVADDAFADRLSESIPPLIGHFLPDQSATVQVDGRRVTFALESMQPASPLVSTLLGSLVQAGRRFDADQSLKELALAMHNFHDVWSGFPPPASYDGEGRPLLSWRVHLLRFLGERELYGKFHLDEPWDSPHNSELIAQMPDVFQSNDVTLNLAGKTRFLLPVAEETPWHGRVGTTFREITDGTSNTIMIVEADRDHAVVWTQPVDLPIDWDRPQDGVTGNAAGFGAAFCDGFVQRIRADIDPRVLSVLLTRAAGDLRDSEYDIHPQD